MDGKKSHVLCKFSSARKIVDDRLFKTLVSELPSGIVWIDVPSPSAVSGLGRENSKDDHIWRSGNLHVNPLIGKRKTILS